MEAVDGDQTRPLHLAARFGHSQAVAKLIGPGAVFGKGGDHHHPFMVIEWDIMGKKRGNIMGI